MKVESIYFSVVTAGEEGRRGGGRGATKQTGKKRTNRTPRNTVDLMRKTIRNNWFGLENTCTFKTVVDGKGFDSLLRKNDC